MITTLVHAQQCSVVRWMLDIYPLDISPLDISPLNISPLDIYPLDISPLDIYPLNISPLDISLLDIFPQPRTFRPITALKWFVLVILSLRVITRSSIARSFLRYDPHALHFPKLNNIYHISDHLPNLSIQFCKKMLSLSVLTFLNTFVSSANFATLLVILSSKSLIYVKNNKGPNTDPCGTPLKSDFQFETSPSTTTRCILYVSHCSVVAAF